MFRRILIPAIIFGICASLLPAKPPTGDDLVSKLNEVFSQKNDLYTRKRPAIPKPLEGQDRVPALNHLRLLLEMETFLRELRLDEKTRSKQVNIDTLSSFEKKRLLDLRNDALLEKITLLIDPPRRPSLRAQEKLQSRFESASKKALSKKSKALKALDKIYSRDFVDKDEKEAQRKLIAEAQTELEELRLAYFGTSATAEGFEQPFEGINPGPAEDLLSKVIKARDLVLKDLRVKNAGIKKNQDGETEAVISGITVRSENLGVLLDRSGSMTPYLQPLRDEIAKDFPTAHFRECVGCALDWSPGGREQVLLFMEDLVIVEKVDAIYWFSDLRDPITPAGLFRLSELRNRGKTRLFALSVDREPPRELEEQIDSFSKHKGN